MSFSCNIERGAESKACYCTCLILDFMGWYALHGMLVCLFTSQKYGDGKQISVHNDSRFSLG